MKRFATRKRSALILGAALRHFARPSAVQGAISNPPEGAFVTNDIYVDMSPMLGGQYARGVFAKREIAYGREIMSIPSYLMYIGDEPLREQVLILTREVFRKIVTNDPQKPYIASRILTMAYGGFSYFTREQDVFAFAESIPLGEAGGLNKATDFLNSGEYSTFDLQKLPLMLEFNRWEVEYRGRKGICIFPEAQYFNHTCEPNVEIAISYSTAKQNFVLSARAIRPIKPGEELFISYFPGNTMPLSRFSLAMRKRWGFECTCTNCKSRAIGGVTVVFCSLMLPFAIMMRRVYVRRMDDKQRGI